MCIVICIIILHHAATQIGGSCLTDKGSLETVQTSILETTAQQVAEAFLLARSSQRVRLVLLHGAGSFGHFTAKEYDLVSGGKGETWREGMTKTRHSVKKLNALVVNALAEAGLPAVGVSPFPSVTTDGRKLNGLKSLRVVPDVVEQGLLPVLHGDVVLDSSLGCTILSGDTIMEVSHRGTDTNARCLPTR